ncbi:MAG TPA: nicotinate (nicotinamide) nucleotide adenylyltransferase [Castellaniella sp.]|uniref:nicotinate (nicotinamide) nucleotide adenylyltransferase n=1 Tax=Castellaniella sp. TaxID=1955812 RepID=UPI002EEC182A
MAVKTPLEIGLLGGSFDPVHGAHIALAEAALESLKLDHVELLPAGRPWQRGDLGAAPEHRLHMLQIACAGHPGLRVNPIEIQRQGATYTLDTLLALPPGPRYTWIMGTDQLANFCTWRQWPEILHHVRLAVAQRPGTSLVPPAALAAVLRTGDLVQIPFEVQPVSATAIRQALASGNPADDMLNSRVLAYIRTHRLYAPHTPPQDTTEPT